MSAAADAGTWLGRLRRLLRTVEMPLRPPGARPEGEFVALCIRCNRCIEVCPYDTLIPAGLAFGVDAGTPLMVARDTPCYLCMLCPPSCPTGALDARLTEAKKVRIGRAVVDESRCYAFQGILCRTCNDECPFEGVAIHQDRRLQPVVTDACVGCGICERVCPAAGAAIHVRPMGTSG